jgi:hypothetical protein
VEGLSLGARGELDLGRLRVDGTGRIATTNAALDVEAGVLRERTSTRMRLAVTTGSRRSIPRRARSDSGIPSMRCSSAATTATTSAASAPS